MKRSHTLALVLMGGVAMVALAGRGLKQDPAVSGEDAMAFTTLEDCKTWAAPQDCEKGLSEAQARHAQEAPRFAAKADCEAEFGAEQCGPAPARPGESQTSAFSPFLMGFLLSRALSGPGIGMAPAAAPLYRRTGSSTFSTAAGARIGTGTTGAVRVPSQVLRQPARPSVSQPSTVSRGGFGSTGRSMSSPSGS
jgi:uncharacterized protein YgiB involved in biofilm formation